MILRLIVSFFMRQRLLPGKIYVQHPEQDRKARPDLPVQQDLRDQRVQQALQGQLVQQDQRAQQDLLV
jgi:hypothetical protein